MPRVHLGQRQVSYRDTGGNGTPLLLAHGFFLDASIWDAVAAELGPEWRVIGWDTPGHGGSPVPDEPFGEWDLASEALALLDHLNIDTAVLGGLSQGGWLALRVALLAPNRVQGLLLCGTEAGPISEDDRIAYQDLFAALAQQGPVEEITVPLSHQIVGPDETYAAPWRAIWRERELPLGTPVAALLGRDDLTQRLDEITCPALIVWGSHDAAIPYERMEQLSRTLPGAGPVHVIDGAAHAPPVTHPAQLAELIRTGLG